jgi:hypothetical protein
MVALAVLSVSAFVFVWLAYSDPPVGIAAPTPVFRVELQLCMASFLLFVIINSPVKVLVHGSSFASVLRLFSFRPVLPLTARVAGVLLAVAGLTVFGFWSVADLLGGYNGYHYSFAVHPFLRTAYGILHLGAFGSWDVGNEASVFFAIAITGVFVLLLPRGLGAAAKDSLTLFAAPALIAFELGLWYFARADMSWHAVDYLWIGGPNDMGWRSFDGPSGGSFLVSNWLVLLVSALLVASRLPLLEVPSRMLWSRARMQRRQ